MELKEEVSKADHVSDERNYGSNDTFPNLPVKFIWSLLESIPFNISVWKDGHLVYANPVFFSSVGVKSGDLNKLMEVTEGTDYFDVHPEDFENLKDKFVEIKNDISTGSVFHSELRMKSRTDKEYKWYSTYVFKGKDKLTDVTIEVDEDISEKVKILEKLNEAVKEKETLLKEVHHRVKNNFQIVSSLLRMQQHRIQNEELKDVLLESENRVRSMAMVHETLYKAETLSDFVFGEYIKELVKSIVNAYSGRAHLVNFRFDLCDSKVGIDISVPCSLIINEVITNSFKHGLDDSRLPEITIGFTKQNGMFRLLVKDNGVGYPDSFIDSKKGSLGTMLINTLANQLSGTAVFRNNDGAEVDITFPEEQ